MAFRTFQFCVVFAISLWTASCSGSGAGRGPLGGGAGGGAPAGAVPAIPLSLLVTDPLDLVVARGQNATLRCPVALNSTGKPILTQWWHDGQRVLPDSRRQILEDGALHIRKVAGKRSPSLEGLYHCNVTNAVGSLRTNGARVRLAMLARNFTQQPRDVTVHENQASTLRCSIPSIPNAAISWERDRVALSQNMKYVKLTRGDLLILSTQPSDAGSYRCKALNKISKKHRYSNEALLSVLPPMTEVQAPRFLVISNELNYTVSVGTDLSLYCAATGNPRPNIRWTNNASAVIGNSSILTLRNITAAHSGNYTCMAYSSAGQVKQAFNVSVVQPPFFVTVPISQWFPNSMTVRLDCLAEGIPPPKIRWLKDGEPLQFTARVKLNTPTPQKPVWTLVFSHTFSYDQGLYQCVAENPYGRVWSAVQLSCPGCFEKQSPRFQLPPAPQNVRCRSFNNSSVCLQWEMPPGVVNFMAFSAHSYNPGNVGKEYVTNGTYYLAEKLDPYTNYTFYVRLYTLNSGVSDQSENVTCESVLKGSRNLKMNAVNNTTLHVEWTTISSDTPCGGVAEYKIQWRKYGHASNNAKVVVNEKSYTLTDLIPSQRYEIRVQSPNTEEELPWMEFVMSGHTGNGNSTATQAKPVTPVTLEAEPISSHKIKLSWKDPRRPNDIKDGGYYVICYRETKSLQACENEKSLKSKSTTVEIDNLNSYTQYEFKVRAHNLDGSFGLYSHSVECRTLEDVPNPVTGLLAKVLNGSVCVRWLAPNPNGQLLHYVISFSDKNESIDQWPNLTIPASKVLDRSCLQPSSDSVSIRLPLEAGKNYKVAVRAATKIGFGKPTTINVDTNKVGPAKPHPTPSPEDMEDIYRNQKLGIIVGTCISLLLIVACISCMIFRRRCLKARARERARCYAPRSTNGQGLGLTAAATQASGSIRATVAPLEAEGQCTEAHELQCLVETNIPPVQGHVDTKGGVSYPNGQANGLKSIANGHIPNGHVHITENPQFEQFDCNGYESHQLLTSRPADDSLLDDTFNSTQLTNLEESLPAVAARTLSPILGPNG